MRKILITGGAGFIGSNLSLKLLSRGYQVRVLDNLSPQIHGASPDVTSPLYISIKDKVEFFKGDILNKKDLEEALSGQDAVIHFAAETGTGQSMYEIKKYCDVNVGGTAQLLDILTNQKHTIQKIVVASSRAIYGEGKYECNDHGVVYPYERKDVDMRNGDFECKCPVCNQKVNLLLTSEESKIHPSSVYGITKQNQEQMTLTVGKAIGVPAVAFRYQNVYGPGQSLSNAYTGILSIFSTLILNGKDLNIFEDGKESRDFIYIDDVVEATMLGLETEKANNLTFNIGTGVSVSVNTVADLLMENYSSQRKSKITGNYRIGDIRHNLADISLARKVLKFEPFFSFDQGIENFTSWVKMQTIESSGFERSFQEMQLKGLLK
jgi:dTDP-L-rhamnose 4-epimerase